MLTPPASLQVSGNLSASLASSPSTRNSVATEAWEPLYLMQVEMGAQLQTCGLQILGCGGSFWGWVPALITIPLFIVTSEALPISPVHILILALQLLRVIPAESPKPDSSLSLAWPSRAQPCLLKSSVQKEALRRVGTPQTRVHGDLGSPGGRGMQPSVLVQL